MEEFQKALKVALSNTSTGKREGRQAEILKIVREKTAHIYGLFLSNKISSKELGNYIRKGEADYSLIWYWKKSSKSTGQETETRKTEKRAEEEPGKICCLLCIRKGKRCVCRKVSGIECTNCLCKGECR